MPRDSNGNYVLPAGNPVVSGELIASSWANPTMQDIAVELTNSLDRQGRGGMLGPFKFADGTVGAPSLTFNNEPTTGIYRFGAQDVRMSIGGQDRFRWFAGGAQVWDGTALVGVANQNQIDTLTTAVGNINANAALLNADNIFINGYTQTIRSESGAWVINNNVTSKSARFSFGVTGDTLDLALYQSGAWSAKFLADFTDSTYRNTTHKFQSISGAVTFATFSSNSAEFNASVYSKNSNPAYFWWNTSAPTDQKVWLAQASTTTWDFSAWNDALGVNRNVFTVVRSAGNISTITYGNGTNFPAHNFYGNQTLRNATDNILWLVAESASANNKWWSLRNTSNTFSIAAWDDTSTTQAYAMLAARSGASISNINFYTGTNSLVAYFDGSGISLTTGKSVLLGSSAGFTDTDASSQKSPRVRDVGGFKGGCLYWNDTALLTGNITYGTGAAPATGTAGTLYLQIV